MNGPSHDGDAPGRPSESEFLQIPEPGPARGAPPPIRTTTGRTGAAPLRHVPACGPTRSRKQRPPDRAAPSAMSMRTEDQNLRIIGTVNGALMGTRFVGADVPAPGAALDIKVSFLDEDEPGAVYTVDVFRDVVGGAAEADVVQTACPGGKRRAEPSATSRIREATNTSSSRSRSGTTTTRSTARGSRRSGSSPRARRKSLAPYPGDGSRPRARGERGGGRGDDHQRRRHAGQPGELGPGERRSATSASRSRATSSSLTARRSSSPADRRRGPARAS